MGECPKVTKSAQSAQSAQKCPECPKMSKSVQSIQKCPESAQSCLTTKNSILNFFLGHPVLHYINILSTLQRTEVIFMENIQSAKVTNPTIIRQKHLPYVVKIKY